MDIAEIHMAPKITAAVADAVDNDSGYEIRLIFRPSFGIGSDDYFVFPSRISIYEIRNNSDYLRDAQFKPKWTVKLKHLLLDYCF